jgi:hypothetical protein
MLRSPKNFRHLAPFGVKPGATPAEVGETIARFRDLRHEVSSG